MTNVSELQGLLALEEIHSSHFEERERRATHLVAKVAFRLAADKELNRVRWVKLLIELAKAQGLGRDIGVGRGDLAFWVEDESREGESYERFLSHAEEPWIRAVVRQLAHDEATNADLLRQLLTAAR